MLKVSIIEWLAHATLPCSPRTYLYFQFVHDEYVYNRVIGTKVLILEFAHDESVGYNRLVKEPLLHLTNEDTILTLWSYPRVYIYMYQRAIVACHLILTYTPNKHAFLKACRRPVTQREIARRDSYRYNHFAFQDWLKVIRSKYAPRAQKVLCGSFLCAIYKFSFIHSFNRQGWNNKIITNKEFIADFHC